MKLASLVALLMMAVATPINLALADHGNASCCMRGTKVCVLEVSKSTEEVTRFEVEAKEICIPGIEFPWSKCGQRQCGHVRTVCVLKEVKQEKDVCKYDWSLKTICTACCRKHGWKHRCDQVNRDEQVPFEYYVADPAKAEELIDQHQSPVVDGVTPQGRLASANAANSGTGQIPAVISTQRPSDATPANQPSLLKSFQPQKFGLPAAGLFKIFAR